MRGKGLKMVYDRPGLVEDDYNFSAEMLEEMIWQLDRLTDKYGSPEWNAKATANRVVELLVEHRALIQVELNKVTAGARKLTDRDFLGPKERRRRLMAKQEADEAEGRALAERKDWTEYFNELNKAIQERKMKKRRREIERTEEVRQRRRQTRENRRAKVRRKANDQ